jgi:hypothetical protein
MILRSVMCDAVVSYFESYDWKELVKNMARGKEVRHAHVYADSILHPEPLLRIVEEYFKAHGLPLQRGIYLLTPGPTHGMTDIYNIHPKPDWGHCELILRYSQDHILAPMTARGTRTGRTVDVWDDAFMENHYAKYNFKSKLTAEEEKALIGYFNSPEWEMQYLFMKGGTNRHTHSLVETSIHPELLNEYGVKAMEAKGFEVTKAVSVVYNIRNFDVGKITYLLKKPEVMFELEWDYNPNIIIRPGAEPMVHTTTLETLYEAMEGCDYIRLDEAAVQEVIQRIKVNA